MKMQFRLIVTLVFFLNILIHSQAIQLHQPSRVETTKSTPVFTKIEKAVTFNKKVTVDFYPLKTGDFWEYIEEDTTTLYDVLRPLKFTIAREVIGDSLLPNNIFYKMIKHENCANSIDRPIKYELQRVDSTGKVFIYANNQDQLLYDFSKGIGETYSSHHLNHYWKILNKYNVIGFGDTLLAIDFGLYDQNNQIGYSETVVEKFGLVFYKGIINGWYLFPEGNFWGGFLHGTTYGNLLVKKQNVDWSEFYPLHMGDFWKYKGHEGVFETITVKSIVGDTLMPDSNIYKVIVTQKFGGPYPRKETIYERINSNTEGEVLSWNSYDSLNILKIKFSVCLGDTFGIKGSPFIRRIDEKIDSSLKFFSYPDVIFEGEWYTKGLGLHESTIEGGGDILVGAVINGIVYGDTTVTSITEKENKIPAEFKLYPNYPNPFNPSTVISYQLPAKSFVTLKVFDVMGSEVAILANEEKDAGNYQAVFDAKKLASGIYFYTLRTKNFTSTQKMILIK